MYLYGVFLRGKSKWDIGYLIDIHAHMNAS